MPYCTLCGSAQAHFTDSVPAGVEIPVLRTSGLLARSNKVMYDLLTGSVFDTFTGRVLSGPLRDAGIVLEQATVVVTTWGEWKAAHPETRIVARDGGLGRQYPEDPLRGRDDDGPIFPIGDADPRLPVQALVVGVIGPDGGPVAFPADQARAALADGAAVAAALRRGTAYVGLVASPTRAAAVRAWLLDEGVAPEAVATLRAPCGMDLGATTPEEVAVSILAELVAVRRGRATFATPSAPEVVAQAPPDEPMVLTDPVCGMTVDREIARHIAEHAGVIYAFSR